MNQIVTKKHPIYPHKFLTIFFLVSIYGCMTSRVQYVLSATAQQKVIHCHLMMDIAFATGKFTSIQMIFIVLSWETSYSFILV